VQGLSLRAGDDDDPAQAKNKLVVPLPFCFIKALKRLGLVSSYISGGGSSLSSL
jgi:hypothetical protein